MHTLCTPGHREPIGEPFWEPPGSHGRAPAPTRPVGTATAQHGKTISIEKIWQKMAKMASEAENKILHEMGDSTDKILAKAKATVSPSLYRTPQIGGSAAPGR